MVLDGCSSSSGRYIRKSQHSVDKLLSISVSKLSFLKSNKTVFSLSLPASRATGDRISNGVCLPWHQDRNDFFQRIQRVVLPVTASGRQGRLRAGWEYFCIGASLLPLSLLSSCLLFLWFLCFSPPSLSSVFFSPRSEFIATVPMSSCKPCQEFSGSV